MSWWDRATNEQKLAQIDAGIELGMTGKQISMCLRADKISGGNSKVTAFGRLHGRHFPTTKFESGTRGGAATKETYKLLAPRLRGTPEHMIDGAFDIFERENQGHLLEPLSYDLEAAE